jgi:hypothetical protein
MLERVAQQRPHSIALVIGEARRAPAEPLEVFGNPRGELRAETCAHGLKRCRDAGRSHESLARM